VKIVNREPREAGKIHGKIFKKPSKSHHPLDTGAGYDI
jgi:hypothetical protein